MRPVAPAVPLEVIEGCADVRFAHHSSFPRVPGVHSLNHTIRVAGRFGVMNQDPVDGGQELEAVRGLETRDESIRN